MNSYKYLINEVYAKKNIILAALTMRYTGPREALFHALIRNFGCTHF